MSIAERWKRFRELLADIEQTLGGSSPFLRERACCWRISSAP